MAQQNGKRQVFYMFVDGTALADEGIDVWLINSRGSAHSRKHKSLSPDTDEEFWNFSWQEYGLEDIPAAIDHVLTKTERDSLYFIGHSMGALSFLVMAANKEEYACKVKKAILLAPTAYFTKMKTIMSKGSSVKAMVEETMAELHKNQKWEGFKRCDVPETEHQFNCSDLPEMVLNYCTMALEMIKPTCGYYLPSGTSWKIVSHFFQLMTDGVPKLYDYGSEELNNKYYSQGTPPVIDFKKVQTPIIILYGASDELIQKEDIDLLTADLQHLEFVYTPPEESFNHFDVVVPTSDEAKEDFEKIKKNITKIIKDDTE